MIKRLAAEPFTSSTFAALRSVTLVAIFGAAIMRSRALSSSSGGEFAYAARNATRCKGISSLKLDSDPLGSPFLNDSAETPAH